MHVGYRDSCKAHVGITAIVPFVPFVPFMYVLAGNDLI
jgi:hypothetical protein